jgi:4-carboxymuconolactone decarboxylase
MRRARRAEEQTMDERRERGAGFFGQVLGDKMKQGLEGQIASSNFGKECATWSAEFAFGTVWTRPGLDRKLRSCVVLGMLMALRQTEEIKYHVRVALANGLTVGEIEEVLYMAVPYAGFPAANSAKQAMIAALAEMEAEKAANAGPPAP